MNNLIPSELSEKFWLVSADMGYGHQRAIYPLKELSKDCIIVNANTLSDSSPKEKRLWKEMLKAYEFMSRAGKIPLIGSLISKVLDTLLYIPNFYPIKDRSNSTMQVRYLKISIQRGLCKGIVDQINRPELPLITSFYSSAIAAEISEHKKIYCIICDTDISRVWASENAPDSHIVYFASGSVSVQRLHSYGVPEKNILLTGFPLPLELLGDRNLNILRTNLNRRLKNLDPNNKFNNLYKHSVNAILKYDENIDPETHLKTEPITITYAVGGAGAQKEIGRQISISFREKVLNNQVKLNLVAGTRAELRDYFEKVKREVGGNNEYVQIIWGKDNESYFNMFNNCLNTTDILWTKPSELSFYCALGIPIIMTPAIGPQEKCNHRWLREIGAGFKQQKPELADQWLFDLLRKGRLAEAAWNGFLKARKYGTYNILDFLLNGTFVSSNDPLKR
jgi:hypothetical protein